MPLRNIIEDKSLVRSLAASATILALIIPTIPHSYQTHLSLDPGDFSYNARGWLPVNDLGSLGRETMSITKYNQISTRVLRDVS